MDMYFVINPCTCKSFFSTVYAFIINYLLTNSEVFTGKSPAKTLPVLSEG